MYLFVDGHEDRDMKLDWVAKDPVQVDEELELPQFDLVEYNTTECTKSYKTG